MQCRDCEFFVLEVCILSDIKMNPNEYFSDDCKLSSSCKEWEKEHNFRKDRTCGQCDFYTADMVCSLDGEIHEIDEERSYCVLIDEYRNGESTDMINQEKLTFEDVTNIDMRLLDLVSDIQKLNTKDIGNNFCADTVWSREFKPRMCRIVGWEADKEELREPYLFEMVYRKLYNLMPVCGEVECGCEQELFEREGKNEY